MSADAWPSCRDKRTTVSISRAPEQTPNETAAAPARLVIPVSHVESAVTCARCGAPIDEPTDLPAEERSPCSRCGSRARAFAAKVASTVTVTSSVNAEVERGLNDVRLAVLGILVSIGLTVGFGVGGSICWRVAAGVGAFAFAAFLIWWRPVRKLLMAFMHRLTGH